MKFDLYKPVSYHPDWDELYSEARRLAREISGVITSDKDISYADRASDINRHRKSYVTTLASYFENRRRLRKGDHNIRPLYWVWAMLNNCNLRCTYCDDHSGRGWFENSDENTLDTENGKRLMRVMRTGCSSIYFCGGEPTLRDDLPEFVDEGWNLGYYPMAMNSNISILHRRLKKPEWKDVLRKLDILVVSIDALNPQTLDKIYQRPLGRRVLVNALMLRELQKTNKFMLIANSVVTPDNLKEARAVLDWCNDLGIFYAAVPANFKERPNPQVIQSPEYRNFVETVLARKRKGYNVIGSENLLDKFLYAKPYTCLTTMKPHIGPDGSLPWPCRASINVEPIYLNVLNYSSVDEMYDEAARFINPTNFHGPARNQCGGNCAWYQNYTTEVYRETLLHPWKFIPESRELISNL